MIVKAIFLVLIKTMLIIREGGIMNFKLLLGLCLLVLSTYTRPVLADDVCTYLMVDRYDRVVDQFTRVSYSHWSACNEAEYDCRYVLDNLQARGQMYGARCVADYIYRQPSYPSPYPYPYPQPHPRPYPRDPRWPDPRDPRDPGYPRDPRDPRWPDPRDPRDPGHPRHPGGPYEPGHPPRPHR